MNKRGMGKATKGGGLLSKRKPVKLQEGGDPQRPQEIYEVLGRRVTKEEFEKAGKRMEEMEKDLPAGLLDFGKSARERAAQARQAADRKEPVSKKKGGMVDRMGRAVRRKTADVKGRAMKKGN
jgi:hypothetical protein